MMLAILYYSLVLMYACGIGYLYYHWKRINTNNKPRASSSETRLSVSVVVVVRNEEKNIKALMTDLFRQSYPVEKLEVIVVNDHSTDSTYSILKAMSLDSAVPCTVLNLQAGSGKKAGLELGISDARGEVILITDGDCRVPEKWVKYMTQLFQQQDAAFVSGPVTYFEEDSFFSKLQTIEFASLVGSGAALLQAGRPGMCNAANMAFRRSVYKEVGGYRQNLHIPSGDDEFLLQAVAARYPQQVFFLKEKDAMVRTAAQPDWQSFYQQRKRWAGKWRLHQKPSLMLTAIGVFLFHFSWIVLSVAMCIEYPILYFFVGAMIKLGAELLFLQSVLLTLGHRFQLIPFTVMQLIHPFYVLFFGVAVNFGSFSWKGRTYKYANT